MISSKPGTIGHGGIVANRQRAFQMRFIGRLRIGDQYRALSLENRITMVQRQITQTYDPNRCIYSG